jgi:hypothetical protein
VDGTGDGADGPAEAFRVVGRIQRDPL